MPSRQEFIDFILDHYENPRHHGALTDANVVMHGGNPGCGDQVTLYLKLDGGERITDIAFEGDGCTISQAAASLLTEKVVGRSLAEAITLSADELMNDMGKEVVATRPNCVNLALNTLKAAERKYHLNAAQLGLD